MLAVLIGSTGVSYADLENGKFARTKLDYKTALRELMPLAEQGNPDAQNEIASMYRAGEGVPQNIKTAIKWFKKSARQGFSDATLNLGELYNDDGYGVPQNYKTAINWYKLASFQGNCIAKRKLTQISKERSSTPPVSLDMAKSAYENKKYDRAFELFKQLANTGNSDASYWLGLLYKNGWGIKQDYIQAFSWFVKPNYREDICNKISIETRARLADLTIKRIKETGKLFSLMNNDQDQYGDFILKVNKIFSDLMNKNKQISGGEMQNKLYKEIYLYLNPEEPQRFEKQKQKLQLEKNSLMSTLFSDTKPSKTNSPSKPTNDIQSRLSKLKKLEDAGLITKEEAAEKRKAILGSL